ncbi:ATPase, T2SS/T4P/T4SS family [uncultured Variovorax sp.]|uniref:ATPase, T2SS/T4P/T4SS family n=2 Tax=Pseudomonadota TaxID=1224 RepID=UPI00261194E5|nr:ATPase, T2SS/T4P/T4SS family [uncultured Variovorax sp.]
MLFSDLIAKLFGKKKPLPKEVARAPVRTGLVGKPVAGATSSGPARRAQGAVSGAANSPSSEQPVHSTWGGLRFSRVDITTTDDLADIVFDKVINEDINLAPHLFSSVAIARVNATEKHVVLFVNKEKAKREEIEAVLAQLRKKGYTPVESQIQAHFASSSVVMALSQGHVTYSSLQFKRGVARDPARNALMNAFTDVVSWAYANKADDIDFAVNREADKSQICFKIGGRYIRPDRWLLPTDTLTAMLGIAWQMSGGGNGPSFDMRIEQQALVMLHLPRSKDIPDGARVRLRWSSMAIDKGAVVTTRIQRLGESATVRSPEAAGYLRSQMNIMTRVIHSEGGMVVLAGVVGSGKSTSLVQLIDMLPSDIKIQSFEDPVELELKRGYQKTVTRDLAKAGDDGAFVSATRALYRSALDVFYLGEIRDRETGLVARQVAESGHSVYTTTHARSGLGIVDRFASPAIAINRDVLATPGILKLLMYQALLPTNCPHCALSPADYAKNFSLTGDDLEKHNRYFERIERLYGADRGVYRLRSHHGCSHCKKPGLPELNGFTGRTVVSEMIEPDEQMLEYMAADDGALKLYKYWRSMASPRFDDDNLIGKDTMECAIYKAIRGTTVGDKQVGLIDPREIEPRFMSFETVEFKREQERAVAARRNTNQVMVPDGFAAVAASAKPLATVSSNGASAVGAAGTTH